MRAPAQALGHGKETLARLPSLRCPRWPPKGVIGSGLGSAVHRPAPLALRHLQPRQRDCRTLAHGASACQGQGSGFCPQERNRPGSRGTWDRPDRGTRVEETHRGTHRVRDGTACRPQGSFELSRPLRAWRHMLGSSAQRPCTSEHSFPLETMYHRTSQNECLPKIL